MSSPSLFAAVQRALVAANFIFPQQAQEKMVHFLQMLARWNRVFNLTAIREPEDMVFLHLLDSLSILPFLNGTRLIDIGSGGGLPGIPLALACPEKHFTLLDSNGKKTRFLQQVVAECRLENLSVVTGRAELYQPDEKFDCIMTRAFASLGQMLETTAHLANPDGRFLAMKGAYPAEELTGLPDHIEVTAIHRLTVPGIDAERHLVCLSRKTLPLSGQEQHPGSGQPGNIQRAGGHSQKN